jgi:hypothetical protein
MQDVISQPVIAIIWRAIVTEAAKYATADLHLKTTSHHDLQTLP